MDFVIKNKLQFILKLLLAVSLGFFSIVIQISDIQASESPFSAQTAHKPDLMFWNAILPYGSETPDNEAQRAFHELDSALKTIDSLRRAYNSESENQAAFKAIRQNLIDLDMDQFLQAEQPLLVRSSDSKRSLFLNGNWNGQSEYVFKIGKQSTFFSQPPMMGKFSSELSLKPGTLNQRAAGQSTVNQSTANKTSDVDESMVVNLALDIDFGSLLFREMLQSMESFHHQFDSASLNQASWPPVKDGQFNLGPDMTSHDKNLLAGFYASTPHIINILNSISRFDKLGEAVWDPVVGEVHHLKVRHRLDLDAIEEHFPGSWDDYQLFYERINFETRFKNLNGDTLARFFYDPEQHVMGLDVYLHNGGVVVTGDQGEITGEVVYPTQVKNYDYKVSTHIKLDLYGLIMQLDQLNFDSRYLAADWHKNPNSASVVMALKQPPKVHVEGALLHIVPSWLIDVLIPGTIESRITQAFRQVVSGNDGHGIELAFRFRQQDGRHLLHANFGLELPYQLLSDAAKSIEERKEKRAKDHRKRLINSLRLALRQDFKLISAPWFSNNNITLQTGNAFSP